MKRFHLHLHVEDLAQNIAFFDGELIRWSGSLDPGETAVITYELLADFPQVPGLRVGYVEISDGLRRRGDWGTVWIAGSLYFPIIGE